MVLDNVDGNQLYALSAVLHDISEKMVWDDMHDVGYFSYAGRAKGNPHIGWGTGNHASPIHHWQIGGVTMTIAKLLGALAVAKQMAEEDDENEEVLLPSQQNQEPEYFKKIL